MMVAEPGAVKGGNLQGMHPLFVLGHAVIVPCSVAADIADKILPLRGFGGWESNSRLSGRRWHGEHILDSWLELKLNNAAA